MDEIKKCDGCGIKTDEVKQVTVKENGVVGYYDVKRFYCERCLSAHNRSLLENWGQE